MYVGPSFLSAAVRRIKREGKVSNYGKNMV
jgi:hypothetical protein